MSTSSIFSGNSRFAFDFQSIIDRSVAIDSLPLQQLNNTKTLLNSQSTAVTALDAKFEALQNAIEGLESTAVDRPFGVSVQDESILGASVSSNAMEGAYTVEVTSLGAYTVSLSSDGLTTVTDPAQQSISAAASLSLTVDGNTFEVTPESPSLIGLAAAINQSGRFGGAGHRRERWVFRLAGLPSGPAEHQARSRHNSASGRRQQPHDAVGYRVQRGLQGKWHGPRHPE